MNKNYFSFLLCDHGNLKNLYVNGVHIGDIDSNNRFHLHEFAYVNGEKIPLNINNIPFPCPFNSLKELFEHIKNLIPVLENDKKDSWHTN